MGLSFQAPEDISGNAGNRLSEPGTYHLIVTNIREGEGPNGKPCDGFTVEADVLAGTGKDCHGKSVKETLFMPNMKGTEDAQEMSLRKISAFCIATGVMTPDQLGKHVDLDVTKAVGKQLVAQFEQQMAKDDKGKYTVPTKYIQIAYANIYHVDDPDVKDIPKEKEALKMRDADDKKDASYFAYKSHGKAKAEKKREPALAGASADQFDNL
jgi:hypothetical protein